MCGRFTLRYSATAFAQQLGLFDVPAFEPRYNIAPTQSIAVIRNHDGQRQAADLHWGLIPSWADDPSIGNRMINARGETVASKPSFRSAFKQRRCLILADGFYEWQKLGKAKQPYYFTLRDGGVFAFAGLWEHWKRDSVTIDSATIITTEANDLLRSIHERMPVILRPEAYQRWLDPKLSDAGELESLLKPYSADEMQSTPVGTWVNSPSHEGARCVQAAE
ncbi:MAG: SOS response-associated peptidase [Planctomycetaceae bacterium]|nr:SOS response-associated peptidase [Planctomycetaceae bacterium]